MLQIKWRAACCTIPSSLASDDLYDDAASKQLIGGEDKIRRVSQHITRSFGQPSHSAISVLVSDSEDAWIKKWWKEKKNMINIK